MAQELLRAGVPAGRVWLEVDPASQSRVELLRLAEVGRQFGLQPLATGRALMARAEDEPTARLAAAIRLGATIDSVQPADLPHPRAVLRGAGPLAAELAEFPQAVANNRQVAAQCRFELLPRRPVFPTYDCPDGQSPRQHLRLLCEQGMHLRYGQPTRKARCRLAKELELIERMGFSEYFLVVWDIVQYARRQQRPSPAAAAAPAAWRRTCWASPTSARWRSTSPSSGSSTRAARISRTWTSTSAGGSATT